MTKKPKNGKAIKPKDGVKKALDDMMLKDIADEMWLEDRFKRKAEEHNALEKMLDMLGGEDG